MNNNEAQKPNLRSLAEPLGTVLADDPQAVEKLRNGYINLSIDIAELIPAIDGERANDPIILRVLRLKQERDELLTHLRRVAGEGDVKVANHVVVALGVPAHFLKAARGFVRKLTARSE